MTVINPDLSKPSVVAQLPSPAADLWWMCDLVLATGAGGSSMDRAVGRD